MSSCTHILARAWQQLITIFDMLHDIFRHWQALYVLMSCWFRSLQRCQNFHNFVSEISILISQREKKVFFALWPLNKSLTKCYHALSADQLFMHTLHVELSLARGLQAFKLIHSLVDNIAVHFCPSPSLSTRLNWIYCVYFSSYFYYSP